MRTKLIVSGIAVVICEILFFILEQPMKQQGYGILDQQFAWSAQRAEIIFQAWEPIKTTVVLFMLVDMVFPVSLFFLNYALHSTVEKEFGFWKGISLVGMIFDYLENILTFVMLFGTINQIIANSLTILAALKFLAVIPAFLFGLYRYFRNARYAPAGI